MKTIAVIVTSREPRRVAEALRGAVGLTLRGDRVRVALATDAPDDARAIATLTSFGHEVRRGDDAVAELVATADAIEVWS